MLTIRLINRHKYSNFHIKKDWKIACFILSIISIFFRFSFLPTTFFLFLKYDKCYYFQFHGLPCYSYEYIKFNSYIWLNIIKSLIAHIYAFSFSAINFIPLCSVVITYAFSLRIPTECIIPTDTSNPTYSYTCHLNT